MNWVVVKNKSHHFSELPDNIFVFFSGCLVTIDKTDWTVSKPDPLRRQFRKPTDAIRSKSDKDILFACDGYFLYKIEAGESISKYDSLSKGKLLEL